MRRDQIAAERERHLPPGQGTQNTSSPPARDRAERQSALAADRTTCRVVSCDSEFERKRETGYLFDAALPRGIAPYSVGLCVNLAGNGAEAWWTVPAANLWCENETFGVAPSPALFAAFDTIIWARPRGQGLL